MELAWAVTSWLLLGLPVGLVFLRLGRIELCLGVLPFAGSLALLIPVVISGWTGGSLAGQWWKALLASAFLAGIAHFIARGSEPDEQVERSSTLTITLISLTPLVGFGIYNVYVGHTLSSGPPTYSWDAYQMWLVHTKVLATGSVFPAELFSEPQLTRSQWQYPLLLPVTLAWFMKHGSLGVRELHLAASILVAVVPVATFSILSRRISPLLAASLALAPLTARGFLHSHHQVLADPLLVMAAMTGYAAAILAMLRRDRPLLIVGSLALASSVAVKAEGAFWVAACAGCIALLGIHLRYSIAQWIRTVSLVVAPSLFVFVAWDATCRHLGVATSVPLETTEFFVRIPIVIGSIASTLYVGPNVICIPLFIAAVPYLVPGAAAVRIRTSLILLSLPVIYLAAVIAIQALIHIPPPYDINWLVKTSIYRLTFGVVPALLFAAIAAATIRLNSPEPDLD